ncbi:hypothetical protein C8F04DRAFT_1191423 [Mycena alexandri]|uniref:Uncharacterized protein n=1 Tax=Mycena alexandri TaxID=1745969 RepID=A0AAD6WUL7_9AGAR|nr:hypothetical protein C8F04DRAFT_1191423 [Mycena alexandri]
MSSENAHPRNPAEHTLDEVVKRDKKSSPTRSEDDISNTRAAALLAAALASDSASVSSKSSAAHSSMPRLSSHSSDGDSIVDGVLQWHKDPYCFRSIQSEEAAARVMEWADMVFKAQAVVPDRIRELEEHGDTIPGYLAHATHGWHATLTVEQMREMLGYDRLGEAPETAEGAGDME